MSKFVVKVVSLSPSLTEVIFVATSSAVPVSVKAPFSTVSVPRTVAPSSRFVRTVADSVCFDKSSTPAVVGTITAVLSSSPSLKSPPDSKSAFAILSILFSSLIVTSPMPETYL